MRHCGMDVAYLRLSDLTRLSSAVGIAQLVAHAADESILCVRGGSSKITLEKDLLCATLC